MQQHKELDLSTTAPYNHCLVRVRLGPREHAVGEPRSTTPVLSIPQTHKLVQRVGEGRGEGLHLSERHCLPVNWQRLARDVLVTGEQINVLNFTPETMQLFYPSHFSFSNNQEALAQTRAGDAGHRMRFSDADCH